MSVELKRLEQIIVRDVVLLTEHNQSLPALLIEDFKSLLEEEHARIRRKLEKVSENFSSEELQHFIKHQHEGVIVLSERLVKYAARVGLFYEHLYGFLAGLLSDIWNIRARVNIATVKEYVQNTGLHPDLLSILFPEPERLSGGQLNFMSSLYIELLKLDRTETFEQEVGHLLITHNFNSKRCFHYCISRIVAACEHESPGIKLDRMAHAIKCINQLPLRRGSGYDPSHESLRDMLNQWVREEVTYIENKYILENLHALPAREKIALNTSVATLACMIRALTATQVIPDKQVSRIGRLLSAIVTTKKTETFTVTSFREKYYDIEHGTKQSVIEIFRKAIVWLSRN